MPDSEPLPYVEAQQNIEPNDLLILKKVASEIGECTIQAFKNARHLGQSFLEKTWYTHSTSAFKSLNIFYPELGNKGKFLGIGLTCTGASTTVENVLKTAKTGMPVGEHMDVRIGNFRSLAYKKLTDGSVVRPGAKIGIIDFTRNLPTLAEQENLIAFTRQLYASGRQSLNELAALCNANDPRLEGVDSFYGVSHLAGPLAKRLGFDVFDIANPFKKLGIKWVGKGIASKIAENNAFWQNFKNNFKGPREVFISRQKLVELYGSQTT